MKLCLVALGLALACGGCAAEAIEDPQPEAMPTEPQREPPKRLFYAEPFDPYANIAYDVSELWPDLEAPPRQTPHKVWPR